MGYYVSASETQWRIPPENVEAAYRAACALNDRDDLKSGGRYVKGYPNGRAPRPEGYDYHPDAWFAFIDPAYPDKCADLVELLKHWHFEARVSAPGFFAGSVWIEGYDMKSGDEEYLLAALAPFTEEDSYIEWRGEDGELWRHEVRDGVLHYCDALIKWRHLGPVAEKYYRGAEVEA